MEEVVVGTNRVYQWKSDRQTLSERQQNAMTWEKKRETKKPGTPWRETNFDSVFNCISLRSLTNF